MPEQPSVEERLSKLEAEVADLQRRPPIPPPNGNWTGHLPGPVANDEVFQQMLEYGREFRSRENPREANEKQESPVEVAIAEYRRRNGVQGPIPNWIDNIIGSFENDPEFDKVLEYGREIRASDRPNEEAE